MSAGNWILRMTGDRRSPTGRGASEIPVCRLRDLFAWYAVLPRGTPASAHDGLTAFLAHRLQGVVAHMPLTGHVAPAIDRARLGLNHVPAVRHGRLCHLGTGAAE